MAAPPSRVATKLSAPAARELSKCSYRKAAPGAAPGGRVVAIDQDARHAAAPCDMRNCVAQRALHDVATIVAGKADALCKVDRTEEQHVDLGDAEKRVERLECAPRLDLNDDDLFRVLL